jgi:hypothetical protein
MGKCKGCRHWDRDGAHAGWSGPDVTGRRRCHVIEHVWAGPLRGAIARAGGITVSDSWVHPLDLVEVGLLAADELEDV